MKKTGRDEKLFWLLAALAAGAAAWQLLGQRAYSVQNFEFYADRGEALFHAVRSKAVSYSMPLLSLLVSAVRYHLGLAPELLARAAGLLTALPAFAIGARGGGRARGAFFALAALLAGLGRSVEAEQVIYSLALLVFLDLELLRQAGGGLALDAAGGLAAGLTLLIRSPLFAFPPLAALFQLLSLRPGARRWLAGTLVFLAAAYSLLLPWARLNHSLFGRTIFLEEERSTCNLITGASGIVYTIEGDARAFAGLSRTESPYPWAIKKVLSSPLNYAGAVAKRLWQACLMLAPFLLAAAAGLFFRRGMEQRFLAFFCAYFILVHCLLSIEERYFYPLKFPLALLAAGGAWELLKNALQLTETVWRDRLTAPLFLALCLPAAYSLAAVWRYPAAAKPPLIAAREGLEKYPADPWLRRKLGETLLSYDLTGPGRAALREACALGAGPDLCCVTAELDSRDPQACPGIESRYEALLVKTLRELELGRGGEAEKAFAEARRLWLSEKNGIKAIPYEADRENLRRIIETNKTLWDTDLYAALLYWDPASRAELIGKLGRLTPLTPKLRALALSSGKPLLPEERRELAALESALGPELPASEFDWAGGLRGLTLALLAGGGPAPRAEGPLGLLLALDLSPEETLDVFAPGGAPAAPALKAAAETYLAGSGAAAAGAARRLAAADPDNFAYSLISLKAAGFAPEALREAAVKLKKDPYPLAAGAAAYAGRGGKAEALALAAEAAGRGGLSAQGWGMALLAAQTAGDYAAGLKAAGPALKEHPRSAELLNARGMLKRLSGDPAGARADYEAAVKAGPSFSALMNLGSVLEAVNGDGAARAYAEAVKAAPDPAGRQAAESALLRVSSDR